MKTRKIIADSMPHALKMVRQELGENAIIVNTAVIKTGGVFGLFAKQKYEVTAYAIDNDGDQPEPKFSVEFRQKPIINSSIKNNHEKNIERKYEEKENNSSVFHSKPQRLYQYYSQLNGEEDKNDVDIRSSLERNKRQVESFQLQKEEYQPSIKTNLQQIDPPYKADEQSKPVVQHQPTMNEKNDQLLDEIQQMRKMMMNFMMNEQQGSTLPDAVTKWTNHLKKQGVEDEIIQHILDDLLKKHNDIGQLDEAVFKQELAICIEQIIAKKIPSTISVGEKIRMINIIGPTGVGKTTSIAKLATEQVLKQKRRVAMITTDVYRIAAVEQLKTYAGILNVPIEVVRSAEELKRVLTKLEHYDLIYMDTTGRNYKDGAYRKSISEYLDHPFENDNYLVLSLTTKYEDMEHLLSEFIDSPINKLILTKFDETTSCGSILNIAYKYPYQLAYITNGQSVPEDIIAFDAKLLTRHLLGEEKNNDGSSTIPSRVYASI